jgi:hypothetical protein
MNDMIPFRLAVRSIRDDDSFCTEGPGCSGANSGGAVSDSVVGIAVGLIEPCTCTPVTQQKGDTAAGTVHRHARAPSGQRSHPFFQNASDSRQVRVPTNTRSPGRSW